MANPFETKVVVEAFSWFATDAITITRETPTGGRQFNLDGIYDGLADLQEQGGLTYFNPAGEVEVADATLYLTMPVPMALGGGWIWGNGEYWGPVWGAGENTFQGVWGVVPNIDVGDIVTRLMDNKKFVIVSTSLRLSLLPHYELKLKVGPLRWDQK